MSAGAQLPASPAQSPRELLTQIGPGTAMGALMRQYWLPALASSELPPGVQDPQVMWEARSGSFHAEQGVDWMQAYRDNLARAQRVCPQPWG